MRILAVIKQSVYIAVRCSNV